MTVSIHNATLLFHTCDLITYNQVKQQIASCSIDIVIILQNSSDAGSTSPLGSFEEKCGAEADPLTTGINSLSFGINQLWITCVVYSMTHFSHHNRAR